MRFFITKKVLVGVIIALCAVIYVIFLSGCRSAGLRPPSSGATCISGPGSVLADVALYATWAAGVGLICCGIAAVWLPNKFNIAKVALGCFAALVVAGIMHWIAAHWAVLLGLCAGVLVLSGIGWAYINRKALEKKSGVDLNRDGKIG